MIKVIEIIKKKGEVLNDNETVEWRWVELFNRIELLEEVLSDTYTQVFASKSDNHVVATYPVVWSTKNILYYSDLLVKAGWGRVEMVTEAEAAADAVLRSQPGLFFDECGTNICIVDLGGMTQAFYRVREVEGGILKEELAQSIGGDGGLALVDEHTREHIRPQKVDHGLSPCTACCQELKIVRLESRCITDRDNQGFCGCTMEQTKIQYLTNCYYGRVGGELSLWGCRDL